MVGFFIVGLMIFAYVIGMLCLLIDMIINKDKDIVSPPKIQPRSSFEYDDNIVIMLDPDNDDE